MRRVSFHHRAASRHGYRTLAAMWLALAASAGVNADISIRPVAISGGSADGGLVYDWFDDPTINESGRVLFWARVAHGTIENDECEGAVELPVGLTLVTTVGATDSPSAPCFRMHDAWFKYTAPQAQTVTFLASSTMNNLRAAFYTGDCQSLTYLTCNYDRTVTMTAGQTVYIRAGGNGAQGTMSIRIVLGSALNFRLPILRFEEALFSDRTGSMQMVVRRGDIAAFDPDLFHVGVRGPVLNRHGTFALTGGIIDTPGVQNDAEASLAAMFTEDANGLSVLVEIEPPAVGSPPPRRFLPPPKLSDAGTVAYARLDGEALKYGQQTVERTTPAPGTPKGVAFATFEQPILGPGDGVLFTARLSGQGVLEENSTGVWHDVDGDGPAPLELVARAGNPAPGAGPGTSFHSFSPEPSLAAARRFAFWARLAGESVESENDAGIWIARDAELSMLVREGDAAPGFPAGSVVQSLSPRVALNAGGDAAVLGHVSGPDITASSNTEIWIFSPDDEARTLVKEGDQVHGLPEGMTYASFSDPVLNDRGDVAFLAILRGEGVSQVNSTALMLARAGHEIAVLARAGDNIQVAPGDDRVVTEINFSTLPASSGRGQLNNAGSVVFHVHFVGATSGIFVADVVCTADINTDGAVNSQDFFDFLALFFQGHPSADFNGSGGVDSQDFFDFLAAFFKGC